MNQKDNPLTSALVEANSRNIRDVLSRYGLKANLCLGAALCVSLVLNTTMFAYIINTPNKYFATKNGFVLPVVPSNVPGYTDTDVMEFASAVMNRALQLDFVHYEQTISSQKQYFTTKGYDSFYRALESSGQKDNIINNKLNIRASISPGSLVTEGLLNDQKTYAWQFKYPVNMQRVGHFDTYKEERYDLFVQVIRVSTDSNPNGIAIAAVVLKPAEA